MKKVVLCFLLGVTSALAADLKMIEVEALMNDKNKDVVVIDKKELAKYIVESKKVVPVEVVPVDIYMPVLDEPSTPAVVVMEVKKEKIIVDGLETFKSSLLLEGNKNIEVEYSLDLFSALEITKYIFAEKIQKERYPIIREMLLVEAKKFSVIDYKTFSAACEDMSEAVANRIIHELGGLR